MLWQYHCINNQYTIIWQYTSVLCATPGKIIFQLSKCMQNVCLIYFTLQPICSYYNCRSLNSLPLLCAQNDVFMRRYIYQPPVYKMIMLTYYYSYGCKTMQMKLINVINDDNYSSCNVKQKRKNDAVFCFLNILLYCTVQMKYERVK